MLLRRILVFIHAATVGAGFVAMADEPFPPLEHIPALHTPDGTVGFFNLINSAELADVLHPQSYSQVGLCVKERAAMVHARRLARQLRHWFWCNYDISTVSAVTWQEHLELYWSVWDHFYFKGLAYQTMAIHRCKEIAEGSNMHSNVKECTTLKVHGVIKEVFSDNGTFWQAWHTIDSPRLSLTSLCWTGWMDKDFTVSIKSQPVPYPSGKFCELTVLFGVALANLSSPKGEHGRTPHDRDIPDDIKELLDLADQGYGSSENDDDDEDNGKLPGPVQLRSLTYHFVQDTEGSGHERKARGTHTVEAK